MRAEFYSYLIGNRSEDKKGKETKMYVIKRKLKFEHYKNCLEATQLENKKNHPEKNKTVTKENIKEHNPNWHQIPDINNWRVRILKNEEVII